VIRRGETIAKGPCFTRATRLLVALSILCPGVAVAADTHNSGGGRTGLHSCTATPIEVPGKQWLCGNVNVPYSYSDLALGLLTISFTVLKPEGTSISTDHALFVNPGGPGTPSVWFPASVSRVLPPALSSFALIGVQARGLSHAGNLDCLPAAYAQKQGAGVAPCDSAKSRLLESISTENNARDMDVVRAALGIDTINYYGVSYGTMVGAVYTSLFPERSKHMILDSAVNPSWIWLDQFAEEGSARQRRLDALMSWISANNDKYHLGSTATDVWNVWHAVVRREAGRIQNLPYPPPSNGSWDAVSALAAEASGRLQNVSSRVEAILGGDTRSTPSVALSYTVAVLGADSEWDRYASWLAQAQTTQTVPQIAPGKYALPADQDESIVAVATICSENRNFARGWAQPQAAFSDLVGGSPWQTESLRNRAGDPCRGWDSPRHVLPPLASSRSGDNVIVLQSEDDPVTPSQGAAELSKRLNAKLYMYSSGSHGVFLSGVAGSSDVVLQFLLN